MEVTLCIFLSLVFLVASKLYLSRKQRPNNLPPSPPALPFLGHPHLLRPPMPRTFQSLAQKYGSIFSLRFGSRLLVVVSSPSAVDECFTKNDIVLANRPPNFWSTDILTYNQSTVVHAPYGDYWRNLRRIFTVEILSSHRINMFLSIRKEEVKRLIIKLSQNSVQDFCLVELRPLISEMAFNILMRMSAGRRYSYDDMTDKEEARAVRESMREIASFIGVIPEDFFPILSWIDGGRFKNRVFRVAKKKDKVLQGLLDECRDNKDSSEFKNTMIDHLFSLQESQPEYYTDEVIKALLQTMLLAGIDTLTLAIERAMANVINHPNTLRKARDEIDNLVGQECLLDESHLSKLPYLQNIISETLRLNPPVPLLLPHFASDDCTIGGYDIPHGTILYVNAWALHHDSTLWADSSNFIPERFDVEEDRTHKFLPFGLGRRSCPGSALAQHVSSLALGTLIQCFEWKRVATKGEFDMAKGKGVSSPETEGPEAFCKTRPFVAKILSQD